MLIVKAFVPVRHSRKLKNWTEKNNKGKIYDYQSINGQRCYVEVFEATFSEIFDMAREIGHWVDAGWKPVEDKEEY